MFCVKEDLKGKGLWSDKIHEWKRWEGLSETDGQTEADSGVGGGNVFWDEALESISGRFGGGQSVLHWHVSRTSLKKKLLIFGNGFIFFNLSWWWHDVGSINLCLVFTVYQL